MLNKLNQVVAIAFNLKQTEFLGSLAFDQDGHLVFGKDAEIDSLEENSDLFSFSVSVDKAIQILERAQMKIVRVKE